MARAAAREVRQQVEAQLAVGLGVPDGQALVGGQRAGRVGLLVGEGPRLAAAQDIRREASVDQARHQARLEGACR